VKSSSNDAVLDRAVRLLDAFRTASELTLDELAERSGLARSTAHRLAGQLVRLGLLERSQRGWRLGTTLFELGQLVPRQQRLRDVALAYMEDLYEATRETVQLAVLDESEVLYVEIISGHRKVKTPSRRGGRMPAHCTALGKAMLAFSDDVGRSWIERHSPLVARTATTLADPRQLAKELQDIRRAGLAYDREESTAGLVCVAAPLLIANGTARAAMSVSMPAGGRITPSQVAPAVRSSGRALSRELHRLRT
jgi:IclR family acetate operon transcriptional repressor